MELNVNSRSSPRPPFTTQFERIGFVGEQISARADQDRLSLQRELHNELHARPSVYFVGDTDVWHVAILGGRRTPPPPLRFKGLNKTIVNSQGNQGLRGNLCNNTR